MVDQIEVPRDALALSTLPRVDYADAFRVELPVTQSSSPKACARAVLVDAPAVVKAKLLAGWTSIGLTASLGDSVLGWTIRVDTPEYLLLGRDSLIGMPGELLFKPEAGVLSFSTFVHFGNRAARVLWAKTEPLHVRTVRGLLERAGRAPSSSSREHA